MKKKHLFLLIGSFVFGVLLKYLLDFVKTFLGTISVPTLTPLLYSGLAVLGLICLVGAIYFFRKSRLLYRTYQALGDEDEEIDHVYTRMYRYLDYGTVSSNLGSISIIAMLTTLIYDLPRVMDNPYLVIGGFALYGVNFLVLRYNLSTIALIRKYRLSVLSLPQEVLAYLDSYDEGEKQAELETAYLTLFRLNQIVCPAIYIFLMVVSVLVQDPQLVALFVVALLHMYVNIAGLRKTKSYFK